MKNGKDTYKQGWQVFSTGGKNGKEKYGWKKMENTRKSSKNLSKF